MPAPSVGAVDMGSRNFKFVIGGRVDGLIATELVGKARLDLGGEISGNDGLIGPAKLRQVGESLSAFAALCSDRGVTTVLAIATSAIRNARNREQVVELARDLGFRIELADGEREGVVGYLAATGGRPDALVSDAGSKSIQLAWDEDGSIRSRSWPVGYELAYESFVEHASSIDEAIEGFARFLDGNLGALPRGTGRYIALAANGIASFVGGSERTPDRPRILGRSILADRIAEIRALSPSAFRSLKSTVPDARKVLPGLILVDYVMARSGHEHALVADVELPVGLIVEHFIDAG